MGTGTVRVGGGGCRGERGGGGGCNPIPRSGAENPTDPNLSHGPRKAGGYLQHLVCALLFK